jgi:hypothetical protein
MSHNRHLAEFYMDAQHNAIIQLKLKMRHELEKSEMMINDY